MTSLPTIHSQLETLATTLTKQDSDVADDLLAVRYEVEKAIESPRPADQNERLDNALQTLELSLKMDAISDLTPEQKRQLRDFKAEIESKRT